MKASTITSALLFGFAAAVSSTFEQTNDIVESHVQEIAKRQFFAEDPFHVAVNRCVKELAAGRVPTLEGCVVQTLGIDGSTITSRQLFSEDRLESFHLELKQCGKSFAAGTISDLEGCILEVLGLSESDFSDFGDFDVEKRQPDSDDDVNPFHLALKSCGKLFAAGVVTDLDGCILDTMGIARH